MLDGIDWRNPQHTWRPHPSCDANTLELRYVAGDAGDGLRTAGLREKLEGLEARQAKLRAEIATSMADNTAPILHPNLAETYRVRVQGLRDAIQKSASPEIREALRALIARVEIHPAGDGRTEPRIELIGNLAAMLSVSIRPRP
jgi:hypothetical protein